MKIARTISAVMCLASLSGCGIKESPCCASYPIKAFKAVYEYRVDGKPVARQTWLSDGKGKVLLSQGKDAEADVMTLVDYQLGRSTILDAKNKTAQPVKLDVPWITNGTCEETNATALGAKEIDGHPCKGWKVTGKSGDSEYWLGEDTGCYVAIDSSLPGNKSVGLKLVEYQPVTPEPAKFQVPKDFTEKSGDQI